VKFELSEIYTRLPSVVKPEKKLSFNEKIKWTLGILILFYFLGSIFVYGINPDAVAQFEFLEIVFGSKFGSIITVGIGPIVTASIILQLLVGSGIINWDTKTPEGKAKFTGTQKVLAIAFCILEAAAYVLAGAVPASSPDLVGIVILQLTLGGILIIFMDEVVSKWGIGSGISLFIAAGVSKTIFLRVFNPLTQSGGFLFGIEGEAPAGILTGLPFLIGQGLPIEALISLLPLIATLVVFSVVVFAQDMNIEIPMAFSLPFGKFAARRWPLKFVYTSNIPVILTAAVVANLRVVGKMMSDSGIPWLGVFDANGQPLSGAVYYMTAPQSAGLMVSILVAGIFALVTAYIIKKTLKKYTLRLTFCGALIGFVVGYFLSGSVALLSMITTADIIRSITYLLTMITGSVIFSKFWVTTSGMDSASVAEQFKSSSIVIPGFRRDPRIIERVLEKYIPSITVLGGAFIGLLAGFADLTNAVGSGTGILLTVMILYQIYEQILQKHWDDMPEWLRKLSE
jgi:preprotein translocase subunit SecY